MDAEILVGRTLAGYLMRGIIGRGSMGVVYAARDLVLSHDVAVKVIRPDTAFSADAIDRLHQEARWLLRCDDPHVVRVYGSGRAEGHDYIAMELMPATLQARIAKGRPEIRELVEIGAGILLGLAAAHRAGIIHQDVKPANVGIARDGMVKLLDFGVASPLPWSTSFQEAATFTWGLPCVGSLHYMAPEQLRGEAVDDRADVYSTGAVLYELATGRRPFTDSRPACLINAVLNGHPCPPSLLNPNLPAAIDRVLIRALAKKPARRFSSVLAMMDALLQVGPLAPGPAGPKMPAARRRDPIAIPRRVMPTQYGATPNVGVAVSFGASRGWPTHATSQERYRPSTRRLDPRVHCRAADAGAEGR